jgi:hypothetical protein
MKTYIHFGIVLQSPSCSKYKYIIFDQWFGKIEGVLRTKKYYNQITRSMLVRYAIQEKGSNYLIDVVDLDDFPDQWVIQDLIFFHHVLELMEHCVPYNQPYENLFNLLYLLYSYLPSDGCVNLFKKWWLCRFFFITGLHPDNYVTFSADFLNLISSPFDTMVNRITSSACYNTELMRWLKGCRDAHAPSSGFKIDLYRDIMI